MTRSLFVVEDTETGYVHYSDRNRDELLGEWIPGTTVVEYIPRQRWIPVGERLPEPGGRYLVRNAVGYIGSDLLQSLVSGGTKWAQTASVTHWMTLPEGPEE